MIPNLKSEVERTAADYPLAWKNAHTSNAQTEDFIRILAARLHRLDSKFGLNGKRGNPNDISDDVVNYIGEGPGHDPITGSPVTVIDVIQAAGGPNPQPQWSVIDLPGPGAWVNPGPVILQPTPETKPAQPPTTPYPQPVYPAPDAPVDLNPVLTLLTAALEAVQAAANDAKVAAETAQRIEAKLQKGFHADLGAKFIGSVKGPIRLND